MRPNNQNKRSRGRGGNNNRRHSNPLSRNFESNGPDVKIRGNAAHIAEKYGQLARDAQSSGDSVMAENYLQHAEHYFRILSAAQAQMPQRNDDQNADSDDDSDDIDNNAGQSAQPVETASEPQPAAEANGADSEGSDEPRRKPRERRPRRRPQGEGAPANSSDDEAAPAPKTKTSDLPAFLTDGGQSTAAE